MLCAPLAVHAEESITTVAPDGSPFKLDVKQGAPAGFEQLAAPQETMIDVFFGDEKLGSYRAVYTPSNIAFATPEEIVSKIPSLKAENSATVQKALSGDLSANTDRMCNRVSRDDCGILKPQVAGVIFYDSRFRADLFVNPEMLQIQDKSQRILPPAPEIFSGVHQFNGNITGTDSRQEFSLLANSTFAYGAQRLNLVGSVSNQQKQITNLTASMDRWGLDNQLGLFNSRALQLLPQVSMGGVSVGTSLRTNLDLREAAGSTLTVFLPQRSYVTLIYNNAIYSTDLYDAGNQIINTSALPEGAYEVTIRIRAVSSGAETEERRFFAKNFAIPPEGQSIYFAQLGTVRNTSESNAFSSIGDDLIATAGRISRLSESIALNTDMMFIGDRLYAEAGAFLLLPPDHQFQVSSLVSSEQDVGFGGSYLGYFFDKALSLYANVRVIFAHKFDPIDVANPAIPIAADSQQWTTGLTYQLTEKALLSFDGTYTDFQGSTRQYAYGPRLRYDFWREGPNSLSLTAASSGTNNGPQHSLFLNFTMRLGDWGYSAQGGAIKSPSSGASRDYNKIGDARITWNDDKDSSNSTVVGAEVRHDDSSDSYIADLDHRGRYGNIKLIGQQSETPSGNNTFYSGNLGFSVAHTAHDFAWGGKQQESSGFIFKNMGNAADVPMQVIIDNSEKTTFNSGGSVPVFLAPYQTYNVSIKPTESRAIDYDGSVKRITLYPGNIVPLIWDINSIKVVLGHVVLPDGRPLTDARLEEARNITVTDNEGLFQGEILQLGTLTFNRTAQTQTVFKNQGIEDFALPPVARSYPTMPSNMSLEEQRRAILEIFGDQEGTIGPMPPAASTEPPISLKKDFADAMTPLQQLKDTLMQLIARAEQREKTAAAAKQQEAPPVVAAPVEPVQATQVAPSEEVAPQTPTILSAPKEEAPALRTAVRCRVTLPEVKDVNGVYMYSEPLVCTPLSDEENKRDEEKKAIKSQMRLASISTLRSMFSAEDFARIMQVLAPNPLVVPVAKLEPSSGNPSKPKALMPAIPEAVAKPLKPVASNDSFTVQAGSYRTESTAQEALDEIARKFATNPNAIYNVVKADLGSKGIYYRLRISNFMSRKDASDFCDELAAHKRPCMLSSQNTVQ